MVRFFLGHPVGCGSKSLGELALPYYIPALLGNDFWLAAFALPDVPICCFFLNHPVDCGGKSLGELALSYYITPLLGNDFGLAALAFSFQDPKKARER